MDVLREKCDLFAWRDRCGFKTWHYAGMALGMRGERLRIWAQEGSAPRYVWLACLAIESAVAERAARELVERRQIHEQEVRKASDLALWRDGDASESAARVPELAAESRRLAALHGA